MIAHTILRYQSGSSNKEYRVLINENVPGSSYSVIAKWGRIGSICNEMCKGAGLSFDRALKLHTKLVDSKLAKGYKIWQATIPEPPTKAPEIPSIKARVLPLTRGVRASDNIHVDSPTEEMVQAVGRIIEVVPAFDEPSEWYKSKELGLNFSWHKSWLDFDYDKEPEPVPMPPSKNLFTQEIKVLSITIGG